MEAATADLLPELLQQNDANSIFGVRVNSVMRTKGNVSFNDFFKKSAFTIFLDHTSYLLG